MPKLPLHTMPPLLRTNYTHITHIFTFMGLRLQLQQRPLRPLRAIRSHLVVQDLNNPEEPVVPHNPGGLGGPMEPPMYPEGVALEVLDRPAYRARHREV